MSARVIDFQTSGPARRARAARESARLAGALAAAPLVVAIAVSCVPLFLAYATALAVAEAFGAGARR